VTRPITEENGTKEKRECGERRSKAERRGKI
jgi:hypothetical protein